MSVIQDFRKATTRAPAEERRCREPGREPKEMMAWVRRGQVPLFDGDASLAQSIDVSGLNCRGDHLIERIGQHDNSSRGVPGNVGDNVYWIDEIRVLGRIDLLASLLNALSDVHVAGCDQGAINIRAARHQHSDEMPPTGHPRDIKAAPAERFLKPVERVVDQRDLAFPPPLTVVSRRSMNPRSREDHKGTTESNRIALGLHLEEVRGQRAIEVAYDDIVFEMVASLDHVAAQKNEGVVAAGVWRRTVKSQAVGFALWFNPDVAGIATSGGSGRTPLTTSSGENGGSAVSAAESANLSMMTFDKARGVGNRSSVMQCLELRNV
jgi:hypothetical protein